MARAVWRLEQVIDTTFFQDLQEELQAEPQDQEAVRRDWLTRRKSGLLDRARAALQEAMQGDGRGMSQHQRARAAAERTLEGWFRGEKGFPELFQRSKEEE